MRFLPAKVVDGVCDTAPPALPLPAPCPPAAPTLAPAAVFPKQPLAIDPVVVVYPIAEAFLPLFLKVPLITADPRSCYDAGLPPVIVVVVDIMFVALIVVAAVFAAWLVVVVVDDELFNRLKVCT